MHGSGHESLCVPQNGHHVPRTKRVLIADDHGLIRGIVRRLLEKQGYECDEAKDGLAAVMKARESRPDLIVLDLVMPFMDGYESAQVFREEMPDVPVVILSMYSEKCVDTLPAMLGVKAVVPKSDGMGALLECIRNLLS